MLTIKGLEKIVQTEFSFIEATEKGKYDYWLQAKDIKDIARIEYQFFRHPSRSNAFKFKILNSIQQLSELIDELQSETQFEENRLTLILNLGDLHWVTFIISRRLHRTHLEGFYIDSLGYPFPTDYFKTLNKYHIEIKDFSIYLEQSGDDFNCGLRTLENAADLNKMLDNVDTLGAEQALNELLVTLNRPRNRFYFNSLRYSLAQKIRLDSTRGERDRLNPWKTQSRLLEIGDQTPISESESGSKRLKVNDKMNVNERLELFVSSFLDVFQKNMAACHLIAKGEKLSVDSLKKELIIGTTGAIFGFVVSQSPAGILPSAITSLRTISNHYYVDKPKAQKITQIFSSLDLNALNLLLAESSTRIFTSYEAQFMRVTDKAGDAVAMEKLATDAVIRIMNYVAEKAKIADISVDFITKAAILGNSHKYFDPSIKKLRLSVYGNTIQDRYKNKIYTAALFENVGLLVKAAGTVKLYDKVTPTRSEQYGYRLALDWEKTSQGELLDAYKELYIPVTEPSLLPDLQHQLQLYDYNLDESNILRTAESILSRLISGSQQHGMVVKPTTKSILFDLRNPVENFIGRQAKLDEIHQALLAGRTPAIVNAIAALNSEQGAELTSGSQVSVSGLGGIGKTQLALQYAQLYAADYDNNVLWIDCDSQASLSRSFVKLATKLEIPTKDQFGDEKKLEEVVEASYEYFSDRKSLFIFDNVQNYEEIKPFLPKVMISNKPHLLITSRYTNWQNAATLILLEVFTEEESSIFIKQALLIKDDSQDMKIKELNYVLQGLPLALQQAVSYIKIQQNVDKNFGIDTYLEIFKKKSQAILAFNFREHTNDPYLKTVYTTWQITLEKIKEKGEIGQHAIEILNIMSFIYPENIYAVTFSELFALDKLSLALELLKGYSMIGSGKTSAEYVVHRLVQKVVNLFLQQNFEKFKRAAKQAELIVMHYAENIDLRFHYIFFLLNTLDQPTLEPYLRKKGSLRKFSQILMVMDSNIWMNFFDIIYTRFSKQRYIDFLIEAYLNYRKEASPFYTQVVLDYIEKKKLQGVFSKSEVANIVDDVHLTTHTQYRVPALSRDGHTRAKQLAVVNNILLFKKKLFPEEYADLCSPKRKRSSRSTCKIIQFQQEVKRKNLALYLQKTNQIATFVSTGLFTKNLVSAFIQGDFDSVAINAGLLLSGRFLEKISNTLLAKGESLTLAESTLLEKELALENKAAISIFFNKNVILAGKKKFLGRLLKTATPFVKRGASLFFAYLLYEDVEAYLTEDNDRLSSIISNGALVSIEALEVGIEAAEGLGLLSNIAVITGPIGETAMAMIWLGSEAYEINKGLTAIEQQLNLTLSEQIIQGLRLFFYMGPSERIELKIENNRLVQKGLNFLKEHPEISRFVFPGASSETALHERSEVRLDQQFNITLSESMPDDISEAKLFCAEGGITTESILHMGPRNKKTDFYYCKKTLGLEYTKDRTGNMTLIALNKGDDEVIVVSNTPTKFFVEEGNKRYKGGDSGNVFVLQGSQFSGLLEGGNGIDAINLENFYANSNTSIVLDRNEFLCEKKTAKVFIPRCGTHQDKIKLKNVNYIYGRKNKKDIIFITKDIRLVDGKGGASEINPDIIYITQESSENLKIILRANTLVEYIDSKLAPQLVTYIIPSNQSGNAQLIFPFQDNLQQCFFFECFLKNITAIGIEDYRIQFNFSESTLLNVSDQLFSLILQDKQYLSNIKNNPLVIPNNAYYVFKEGIELKLLDEKHIYAKASSSSTLEELFDLFSSTAHKIKKSFSIQFEYNQTALIGSEKSEIFTTDCLTESYFMGNGGENIYRLLPLNTTSFSLPEVILYDLSTESSFDDFKDTLDLRAVIKKAKGICPSQLLTTKLSPMGNDLVLSLTTNSLLDSTCRTSNRFWPLANVRFKKALFTEWYQKVDILIEEKIAKQISYSKEHGWFLSNTPLLFEEDKKIIVLTNQDISKNSELILYKNTGNFTFFQRNNTDLIFTNAQDLSVAQYDLYTIIFSESYKQPEMREKILSITLIFLDGTVCLKEYETQIDTALDFSNLLKQYPALTNTSVARLTKRATQEAQKNLIQQWLVSYVGVGSTNYLGLTLGVVTLSFSMISLVTGIFFVRRRRHTKENIPVTLAVSAAFLMPFLKSSAAETVFDASPLVLNNAFSIVNQCAKAETLIGFVGLCAHEQRLIYWEQAYSGRAVNFESYLINRTEHRTYSLIYENCGRWELDLNKVDNVTLAEIYWQLPPKLHQKLRNKNIFIIWHKQIVFTLFEYTSNLLTLHTPIGNLFNTVGLSPDWRSRDDIHFLSRFWLTTQQMLSQPFLTGQGPSLLAGLLEVTLLHPLTHATYAYLTNNSNFSRIKPIIRLLADCLQLGFYNFFYLTRLLEWCFPGNGVVWKISLGLHMVHSFYRLTGDLSYWYLGMALFVLPYVPVLLENIGIPVTRGLHEVCNNLVQVFIGRSILNAFSEDKNRVEQQNRELLLSDIRVKNGKRRLRSFASSSLNFFAHNDDVYNSPVEAESISPARAKTV